MNNIRRKEIGSAYVLLEEIRDFLKDQSPEYINDAISSLDSIDGVNTTGVAPTKITNENAIESLEDSKSMLEAVRDEEQDSYDNMPESLQNGERGEIAQEALNNLEEAISNIESAIDEIQDRNNEKDTEEIPVKNSVERLTEEQYRRGIALESEIRPYLNGASKEEYHLMIPTEWIGERLMTWGVYNTEAEAHEAYKRILAATHEVFETMMKAKYHKQ